MSSSTSAAQKRKSNARTHYLYIAVIAAVVLGIAVGFAAPAFATGLKPIGEGFAVHAGRQRHGECEFVAADAGDDAIRSQHSFHAQTDHADEFVARSMAVIVVDVLEAIDVDQHAGEAAAATGGAPSATGGVCRCTGASTITCVTPCRRASGWHWMRANEVSLRRST